MKRHKTYYFLLTVFFLWFCNVFVINPHSVKDVKRDPQSHENNYFGETAKLLEGYQNYGNNIKLGMWNRSLVEINIKGGYNEYWARILKMLGLPPGCNAVDIGANDGDTAFNLAEATLGGRVVAFEMGPPIQFLHFNKKLNPHLKIDIHNVAVSNESKTVQYQSGCKGCNGGIPSDVKHSEVMEGFSAQAVRLLPYLEEHYTKGFIDNICFVKIDTEGHDVVILEDLIGTQWRPPVMWIEWFREYKFIKPDERFLDVPSNMLGFLEDDDYCTPKSAKLFQTVIDLGYEIFEPTLPLRKVRGCKNKYFVEDLLLIERKILSNWMRRKKVKPPNIDKKYEIELYAEENEL